MESTNLRNRISIACCGAILLAGSSAAFSAPRGEHIAALHLDPGEVWWEPTLNSKYAFIEVRMSGPEGEVTRMFPYGEAPYFSALEDGLYKYEMYVAPPGTAISSNRKSALASNNGPVDHNGRSEQQRAARAAGQGKYNRGNIQSGSFRIENGELVDPTIPEV